MRMFQSDVDSFFAAVEEEFEVLEERIKKLEAEKVEWLETQSEMISEIACLTAELNALPHKKVCK